MENKINSPSFGAVNFHMGSLKKCLPKDSFAALENAMTGTAPNGKRFDKHVDNISDAAGFDFFVTGANSSIPYATKKNALIFTIIPKQTKLNFNQRLSLFIDRVLIGLGQKAKPSEKKTAEVELQPFWKGVLNNMESPVVSVYQIDRTGDGKPFILGNSILNHVKKQMESANKFLKQIETKIAEKQRLQPYKPSPARELMRRIFGMNS